MSYTYTYVELGISRAAFEEIAAKLRAAGYDHAFRGEAIDMRGIALIPGGEPALRPADLTEVIAAANAARLGEPKERHGAILGAFLAGWNASHERDLRALGLLPKEGT